MSRNQVNIYPITEMQEVFLRCDNCGVDMVADDPSWATVEGKLHFNYICPSCGNKMISNNSYPHQRAAFDRSRLQIKYEDEM